MKASAIREIYIGVGSLNESSSLDFCSVFLFLFFEDSVFYKRRGSGFVEVASAQLVKHDTHTYA